jgi:hypothetical protein
MLPNSIFILMSIKTIYVFIYLFNYLLGKY